MIDETALVAVGEILLLGSSPGTKNVPRSSHQPKQEGNGPKDERATMIMASEVRYDHGIELSELNYPDIHVPVAHNNHFGGL